MNPLLNSFGQGDFFRLVAVVMEAGHARAGQCASEIVFCDLFYQTAAPSPSATLGGDLVRFRSEMLRFCCSVLFPF